MSELVIAIALWCTQGVAKIQCQQTILDCIKKDAKPLDLSNQNYLDKKLVECLKK